ncbi:Uncharacterised protein [Vibrio cholerae]|nr:Uncharacterised protein [Vibrio cholerae]
MECSPWNLNLLKIPCSVSMRCEIIKLKSWHAPWIMKSKWTTASERKR